MSKIQQLSTTAQEGIRSTLTQGVVHPFVLNDSKATKVLLNNAKLPMAEKIGESPQTSQVQMNTGAFSQVMFNLFNYWNSFPPNQILIEGDLQVTLKEVRINEEINGKKVDALAKFLFDNKKISLFAYCTNQTFMIQGVGHKEFLKSFILPILNKNFTQKKEAIEQYNRLVVESLSSQRLDLEDSV